MTMYEKGNQIKEVPDFNWVVAIFGWVGPLLLRKPMYALFIFGINVVLGLVCGIFCVITGHDFDSLLCAYYILTFLVDGFMYQVGFISAEMESNGWRSQKQGVRK